VKEKGINGGWMKKKEDCLRTGGQRGGLGVERKKLGGGGSVIQWGRVG